MSAFFWLLVSSLQRLLREPRVVRSLAWPVFLSPVVMGGTLIVVALLNEPLRVVGVPQAGVDDGVAQALTDAGWTLVPTVDPEEAVRSGEIDLAIDGDRLWSQTNPRQTLELESVLRRQRGAAWRLDPIVALPSPADLRRSSDALLLTITLLFVLYGLAFGLGALAKDRDEQVLDIELTLPIRAWMPAAARWGAATLSLGAAVVLTVGLLQVFLPSNQPLDAAGRAIGGVAAAAAIGIAIVGGAGLKQGFSGPFAFGSFLVAGAFLAGPSAPAITRYVPIASILTDGPGWVSLLGGFVSGPIAALIFERRVRRSA